MGGNNFRFSKQYRHKGYKVACTGRQHEDRLVGNWELGFLRGNFKMKIDCRKWVGTWTQDANTCDMELDMDVSPHGVSGTGEDSVGSFWVKGETKGNQVTFEKYYEGQHSVFYEGIWEGNSIKGSWKITVEKYECSGTFELHYQ